MTPAVVINQRAQTGAYLQRRWLGSGSPDVFCISVDPEVTAEARDFDVQKGPGGAVRWEALTNE